MSDSAIIADDAAEIAAVKQLEGKIIYDTAADKYYQIGVSYNNVSLSNYPTSWGTFVNAIGTCMPSTANYTINGKTIIFSNTLGESSDITGEFSSQAISLTLEPVGISKLEIEIPSAADRVHCIDQPFDIFCMPYSDLVEIWNETKTATYRSQKNINMVAAQNIGLNLGQQSIYDVQVLPYCPILNIADSQGRLNSKLPSSYIGVREGDNLRYIGKIWWARKAELSFNIDIPATFAIGEPNPVRAKVKSQTQFGRLCAPNYSQFFDFNIQKNRGISGVLVQCNYRPYNPWVKITPRWGGDLYRTPTLKHDSRGLILSGDFSITQVSDAWANYELNNKNYLNIFNRQMENMEFNRNLSLFEGGLGGIVGTGSAAVGGAILGSAISPGVGTAVGGVAGGAAGLLTGGADWALNYMRLDEQMNLSRDMFEYNLGNIKALPQGLARTTAISAINTYVPTLEIWETTPEEESILYNKIIYNGMTISAIGYIGDYINPQEETYI